MEAMQYHWSSMNLEQQENHSKIPSVYVVLFLAGHSEKFHPAVDRCILFYVVCGTGGWENQVIHSHCKANVSAFTFQFIDPARILQDLHLLSFSDFQLLNSKLCHQKLILVTPCTKKEKHHLYPLHYYLCLSKEIQKLDFQFM